VRGVRGVRVSFRAREGWKLEGGKLSYNTNSIMLKFRVIRVSVQVQLGGEGKG
jgi:hypothetical protein